MSSKDKEDLLREAACNGDLELVRRLVEEENVDINSKNSVNGWSALHWGAKRNHAPVVRYLLQHGADKDAVSNSGEIPAQLTFNKEIQMALGGSGEIVSDGAGNLPITPNYLANPSFPYTKHNGEALKHNTNLPTHSCLGGDGVGDQVSYSGGNAELVLKARIANIEEHDFIEVELDKRHLTFEALIGLLCLELDVDKKNVHKIRKLPDTIIRKDKDVGRLQDFQELELVLTTKATSAQSRVYRGTQASTTIKQEQILY